MQFADAKQFHWQVGNSPTLFKISYFPLIRWNKMGAKKVTKQTKNFTRKHLSHTLTSRKKHQAKKKLSENRQHLRAVKRGNQKKTQAKNAQEEEDSDDDDSVTESKPR
jgi:hypothetical protein